MLEAIRKRSASILVKLLFGLLVVSFAAWGIGDVIRGRISVTTVARVGDVDILPDAFSREFQRELARLQPLFGGQLDRDQARSMGLADRVLNDMINRTLFDLAANDLGVAASDDLVRTEISGNPRFHNALGSFDRIIFQQVLQSIGLAENEYVDMVRGDLHSSQLLDSIGSRGAAPKALVDPIYRHRQERRVAETIFIADASMIGIAKPDDAALARYHEENAALFTAPEYRTLAVVSLDAEDLAKEIAVSEERLREAFEERRDEFSEPERRRLQQIVVASEADARRAYDLLVGGRPFAEVAEDVARLAPETVDLGLMSRDRLNARLPELTDVAFSLSKDVPSRPVQSPFGWHVLRVTEVEPAHERTLRDVREALAGSIAAEMAIDDLYELSTRLEDTLGGGASLEEAATRLNLRLVKVPSTDASGRDPQGRAAESLLQDPRILDVAFATPENTESPLTETGTDGYFILRVDGITPAALRPLPTVRNEVAAAWKAELRKEAAEKTARQALERIKGGDDPVAVAAELKVSLKTTAAVTRDGAGATQALPRELIANLFKLRPGEATMARAPTGNVVARLAEVRPVDPFADKDAREALREEMEERLRSDLLAQYAEALRDRFPVTIDRRAVDGLF